MTNFELNCRALSHHRPDLASAIHDASPPDGLACHPTKTGAPTMCYRNQWWYSRIDPVQSVDRRLSLESAPAYQAAIVTGVGLGYEVEWIRSHYPQFRHIIVIESHRGAFRLALENRDLSHLLTDSRIVWIVGASIVATLGAMHPFAYLGYTPHRWVITNPAMALDPTYYAELIPKLQDVVHRFWVSSVLAFSPKHRRDHRNMLQNLQHFHKIRGNGCLTGLTKNCPIICVGAGPSLDTDIHDLVTYHDRAIIIATDTSIGKLIDAQIRPDIIVAIDSFDSNFCHFEPYLDALSDIPLVADWIVCPAIITQYPGPILTYDFGTAWSSWLTSVIPGQRRLHRGLSVFALAYFLAIDMGGSPIIWVGQDMCYYPDQCYASHVKKPLKIELTPTGTPYIRQGDAQRGYYKIDLVPSQDIHGQSVYTHSEFLQFQSTLSQIVSALGIPTINATSGGIGVDGVPNLSLAAVIQGFPVRDFNSAISQAIANSPAPDHCHTQNEITGLYQALDHLISQAKLGGKLLDQLDTPVDDIRIILASLLSQRPLISLIAEWRPTDVFQFQQAGFHERIETADPENPADLPVITAFFRLISEVGMEIQAAIGSITITSELQIDSVPTP